ncbi:hypothetical protein [Bacteroides caecimuris]|uniref:hypothetical protein n=1 Tax=Bacteroides caecimuris TaxID=1796613 RepID=UPI002658D72E|nr:hypothetical protein [Bacteroides caecimuris]
MAVKYVPENVEFLTEWNGFELPKGILNKGVTGCGATSVAIQDEHKTIICSPRINLIKNKVGQHEGLLGVYGDVKNDEIMAYLEKAETPKIMVTYDSMPRLAKLITDKSDWRVVVDEYQYLLIDSGFRSDKAIALLDIVNEFDYVTYLSATPIADKYIQQMEQFKDVPYTELIWGDRVERIYVEREVSAKPIDNAIKIVRNYQNGIFPKEGDAVSKECVIFLNSVTNIANIIHQTKIPPEDVNIIVADTEENRKLVRQIGKGYDIGAIPLEGEPHKMFTFCTSTAFAGCDFYSTCASTFVISDNKKVHTSIDIATELAQIAGRQRLACNPFRKTMVFIYNVDIGESNADIYKNAIEQKLEKSIKMAEWKNGAPDYFKKDVIKETSEMQNIKKYSESYVRYDEKSDSFTVNRWAYLNELFAYDVQHENYQNSIIVKKQLEESGFDIKEEERQSDYKEQLKCILTKEGFADRMKRYCELRQLKQTNPYYIADEIMERQYEGLKLYYDRLGCERIKALGFKEKDLKNELERCYRENDIKRKFREVFAVGERMSTEDIKRIMTEIYAKYGISKKGVATHLERDYGIRLKPIKVAMPDGSRKGGYEFI